MTIFSSPKVLGISPQTSREFPGERQALEPSNQDVCMIVRAGEPVVALARTVKICGKRLRVITVNGFFPPACQLLANSPAIILTRKSTSRFAPSQAEFLE